MIFKDNRNNRSNKTNGSLVLLLGIGIFLLLGLQIAQIFLGDKDVSLKKVLVEKGKAAMGDNSFKKMQQSHPKRYLHLSKIQGRAFRMAVPAYSHNIVEEKVSTNVTLTVFNDPSCGECRRSAQQVVQSLPKDVRVVYKYFAPKKKDIMGGLFRQMAVRSGTWPKISNMLEIRKDDMAEREWSEMLEQTGLSLKKQRKMMEEYGEQMAADLQKDAELAWKADVQQVPTFFINDYLIDEDLVVISRLPQYINRLREGKPALRGSDYTDYKKNY